MKRAGPEQELKGQLAAELCSNLRVKPRPPTSTVVRYNYYGKSEQDSPDSG